MKLKLLLLDSNGNFISRFITAFSTKQDCNLEPYSFTDLASAVYTAKAIGADIFIADETFEISDEMLPQGCVFAYLTDSADQHEIRGRKAIYRFQRADLIYKEILSVSDDIGVNTDSNKGVNGNAAVGPQIYAFFPCGGGVGSSSAAAACAIRMTDAGKKVLYLNLERFGASKAFFEAEGRLDLGDIFYAVKAQKGNLEVKLRNAVKQDATGVCFIESCRFALEMMEISPDTIQRFLSELKVTDCFDVVIVDADILLDGSDLSVMRSSSGVILVSDGSEISLLKLGRIRKAMEIISSRDEIPFPDTYLLFNKFSSKTGRTIDDPDVSLLGGAPRFEGASASRVIRQLAEMPLFDKLPV